MSGYARATVSSAGLSGTTRWTDRGRARDRAGAVSANRLVPIDRTSVCAFALRGGRMQRLQLARLLRSALALSGLLGRDATPHSDAAIAPRRSSGRSPRDRRVPGRHRRPGRNRSVHGYRALRSDRFDAQRHERGGLANRQRDVLRVSPTGTATGRDRGEASIRARRGRHGALTKTRWSSCPPAPSGLTGQVVGTRSSVSGSTRASR